jgi:hypothetical protein
MSVSARYHCVEYLLKNVMQMTNGLVSGKVDLALLGLGWINVSEIDMKHDRANKSSLLCDIISA